MRSFLTGGNSFCTVSISIQFVVLSILSTHRCTAKQTGKDKVGVFKEATIEVNQKTRGKDPRQNEIYEQWANEDTISKY